MASDFPVVNFDWLGRLPAIADAAQQEEATKKALAGLKSGDYQSVRDAASNILRSGGNPDLAVKLLGAATADYAARMRNIEAMQYYSMLGKGFPKSPPSADQALPTPGTMEGAGVGPLGTGGAPAPPPASGYNPTPGIFPPPPPVPGPQGAVEAPTQAAQAPASPSPSEAVLAKAESGMAPSMTPATKLAGPYPTPDTAAVEPAPGSKLGEPMNKGIEKLPLFLQSGAITPVQPTGAVVNPPGGPAAAPGPAPTSRGGDPLMQERDALEAQIQRLPRTAVNSPEGQLLMKRYLSIVDQQKLPPKMIEYRLQLLQDAQVAREENRSPPFYTYQQYLASPDLQKEAFSKEFLPAYKEYRDGYKQAESVLNTVNQLTRIIDHPSFRSGVGTGMIDKVVGYISTLNDLAKDMGFPQAEQLDMNVIKGYAERKQSAQLAQAATGLTNLLTIQRLGGLGRQISDADRNYMAQAFFNLGNLPGGNRLIMEMTAEAAKQAMASGRAAEDYRATQGSDTKVSVVGMDQAVRKAVDTNPVFVDSKGNLTAKGKEFQDRIDRIVGPARGSAQSPTSPADLPGAPARGTPPPTPLQNRMLRRPVVDENGLLLQSPGGG